MEECNCPDKTGLEFGWCHIHVDCKDNCKALLDPESLEEIRAAYEHWRSHGTVLGGCSHGC